MAPTQVRAAEILLKKTIPDLGAVQLSGNPEAPVAVAFTWLKPQDGDSKP